MVHNICREAKQSWINLAGNAEFPKIPDFPLELEVNKRLLSLTQFGDGYFSISNLKLDDFVYISPSIQKVLGYEAACMNAKTFMSLIHPEDQHYFLNFQTRIVNFYEELAVEKINKYKIQYDYRIMTKSSGYKRLLHQSLILHYDDQETLCRSLIVHTDITHIKHRGIPVMSIIGMGDEPSNFDVEATLLFGDPFRLFSKREKQILKLIVQGKKSEEYLQNSVYQSAYGEHPQEEYTSKSEGKITYRTCHQGDPGGVGVYVLKQLISIVNMDSNKKEITVNL